MLLAAGRLSLCRSEQRPLKGLVKVSEMLGEALRRPVLLLAVERAMKRSLEEPKHLFLLGCFGVWPPLFRCSLYQVTFGIYPRSRTHTHTVLWYQMYISIAPRKSDWPLATLFEVRGPMTGCPHPTGASIASLTFFKHSIVYQAIESLL